MILKYGNDSTSLYCLMKYPFSPGIIWTRGHLISERVSCVFNSSKKQTNNFCPSRLGQKLKFSCSFFSRIEDKKKDIPKLTDFYGHVRYPNLVVDCIIFY